MHHKNTLVIAQKYHRVNTILIPTSFAQSTPPIPLGTPVNHKKKMGKNHISPFAKHSHPRYPTNHQPQKVNTPQTSTTILLLHIWVIQTNLATTPSKTLKKCQMTI